jgi:hypothetical protein
VVDVLSFIAGLFAANGIPHFINGITGKSHSTPFGNSSSPVVNVIWGWLNFAAALAFVHYTHPWAHMYATSTCFAVAVLAMASILAHTWKNVPVSKKSE